MKQQEFLSSLKQNLEKYHVENIQDILLDYQEHFTHGLQKGKKEEEISAKLGNPVSIAKAYSAETLIAQVKNPNEKFQVETALKVIGRLVLIAPFNFIVLFIPGVIIFSLLVAGWSVAGAFGVVALSLLGAFVKYSLFVFSFWVLLACISLGFGIFGLAVVSGLVMFFITKFILIGLINYLQWNLKFVLEK
ncbi:MAG: DUF1700 domain-containing protein [Pseudobdellovibrionaceae bacterium]